MKTIRRSSLLFALIGWLSLVGLSAPGLAGHPLPPASGSIAALNESAKSEAVQAPVDSGDHKERGARCEYLITVADDFVVEVYHNGKVVPDEQRELLLERFGATAEKIKVAVHEGDWLVFHVVQNRLRWGGSKYFAVAGCLAENNFGFVSDPASADWSVCDNPAKVRDFITHRGAGRNARALEIKVPWGEGDQYIKEYAGQDFPGKALWGRAPSTWIKYIAGPPATPGLTEDRPPALDPAVPLPEPPTAGPVEPKAFLPKQWPVQILSAIYGTGGKDADVTAKVQEHVEALHRAFSVNPRDLGADPNPYWNKSLHITYVKDGVRREQRRNENETVLPESFYGPQDAGELRAWLTESRWFGEQPDMQFHADQTFTTPGVSGTHRWEATGPNALRLTWSDGHTTECAFDYTWSSFSEVGNGRNVFHLKK